MGIPTAIRLLPGSVVFVWLASPAAAHGFGQRYDLPLPLGLWVLGAGATIVLTFAVTALYLRETSIQIGTDRPAFAIYTSKSFCADSRMELAHPSGGRGQSNSPDGSNGADDPGRFWPPFGLPFTPWSDQPRDARAPSPYESTYRARPWPSGDLVGADSRSPVHLLDYLWASGQSHTAS